MTQDKVKNVGLAQYTHRMMYIYGVSVNEDRAIPGIDGFKPVQRRILFAMYKLGLDKEKALKSARIVGDVIGKYHAHGDTSVYDAMVKMANQNECEPTILGEGNWGSIVGDDAAAFRYTNAKLTKYGASFFDPFYMPVVDMTPNYDGSDKEPVLLPAMLPNLLVNGTSGGIGVGLVSEIPAFTKDSVVALLSDVLENRTDLTPELCMKKLIFKTVSNAQVDKRAQVTQLKQLCSTGIGSITFDPKLHWDKTQKHFVLEGVGPFQSMSGYVKKIWEIDGWTGISSVKDECTKDRLRFVITLSRGIDVDEMGNSIYSHLSSQKHFKCNITLREYVEKDGWPGVKVSLARASIVTIINLWLDYRRSLEVKACNYHLELTQKALHRIDILRLAVKWRDYIISLIKDEKLTDPGILNAIKTKLKISEEDAKVIFDLQWRRLRSLEDASLLKEQKSLQAKAVGFKKRIANPDPAILETIKQV